MTNRSLVKIRMSLSRLCFCDLLLSHPFPRVTTAELSWLVFCLGRQSLATAYVGLLGYNPDYLALDLTLVDWLYQISLSSSGLSSGQILAIYYPQLYLHPIITTNSALRVSEPWQHAVMGIQAVLGFGEICQTVLFKSP